MVQLYIVRHGETVENAQGILQGHIQGHLSEKGKQQAKVLQQQLAGNIHPDRIISSDLQRTIDTANILNEIFHLPLETSALLRERDWGEYTGRAIVSIPKGQFPPSVETIADMMDRAQNFLKHLSAECQLHPEVQSILIVSHGVFSRCILAAASHQTIHDIPIFKNMEMRCAQLPDNFDITDTSSDASFLDKGDSLSHGQES